MPCLRDTEFLRPDDVLLLRIPVGGIGPIPVDQRQDPISTTLSAGSSQVLDNLAGMRDGRAIAPESAPDIAHLQSKHHMCDIHGDLAHTRSGQSRSARLAQFLARQGKKRRRNIDQALANIHGYFVTPLRNRLKSTRPRFVAGDLMRLPFADATFDCVTCGWVIEHLPDPEPGLREMCRVLRPGGSLLLLATEDTVTGALNSRTWKCRTYNRSELRAACERNGLAWSRQFYLSPVHRFLKIGGIIVEAVRVIDAAGQFVMPGMINAIKPR